MTTARREPGRIITFYSYKGGTGRSMALANAAWILASNGYRVLAVDWDLEAPGLHRYFAPFMLDPELGESEGVIDLVNNYVTAAMTPPAAAGTEDPPAIVDRPSKWYEPFANILRYTTSLDWNFGEVNGRKGWLDLIPAGRQGPSYATRMNSFSWQNFYDRLGGGGFIECVKQRMRDEYDFVLIDSRTGASDTSGICTVQLPDVLVVCFTLNRQSIEGARAVTGSVDAQRRTDTGESTLRILPVPTRVEKAEKDKLDLAREAAKDAFAPFLRGMDQATQDQYWGQVEVFYEPFCAYEEILATFGDKPLQTSSLLASMERITGWLSDQQVSALVAVEEPERQRVLAKYARQSRKAAAKATAAQGQEYLYYISYSRNDLDEHLERFFDDLAHEVRMLIGGRPSDPAGFVDLDLATADSTRNLATVLAETLQRSRVLVPIYSPSLFKSDQAGREFHYFLNRAAPDGQPAGILPVLWVASTEPVAPAAASVQYLTETTPEAYVRLGLRTLMRLRRYEEEYRRFVSDFAGQIVARGQNARLAHPVDSSLEDLPSAFAPAGGSAGPATEHLVPPHTPVPESLREFASSIPQMDRQAVADICELELIPHLRLREDPYPLAEAVRLLRSLSGRRFFDLMERVSNELIVGGEKAPVVRRLYATSLVHQNKMTAALAVLRTMPEDADPREQIEVFGLLGRIHQQLYIDAAAPALPRNQQNLVLAIKAYRDAYVADPALLWHGINVVALVARAIRDRVRLADVPAPAELVSKTARDILNTIEGQVSSAAASHWGYAVAFEACIALGELDEALKWLASFIDEPEADAFELASLLRQVTEVWQVDLSSDIGLKVLPILQARLLAREGGALNLSAATVRDDALSDHGQSSLSTIFGRDSFVSLKWYQTGIERCRAVARIEDASGRGWGTGFLVRGRDLGNRFGDEQYLITTAAVLSDHHPGALRPDQAYFSFEILELKGLRVASVLFTSPPEVLDCAIVRLEMAVPLSPYPIASHLPVPGETTRVYIIGHPAGGNLSFSLHDSVLLDHQSPRLHYRTPTEAGSAGSPVFNADWKLIGVHHAGSEQMPRLHGTGTYQANEGIWIGAIRDAVQATTNPFAV